MEAHEAVQAEIAAGNNELSLSVIISASDIEDMGPEMADPYAFLVPNTSCASCHRLNGLRFDFHSLSGFEDRGITVSPRGPRMWPETCSGPAPRFFADRSCSGMNTLLSTLQ